MLIEILYESTLDHTAIATTSISDYVKTLGLDAGSLQIETLPTHGVSVCFIPLVSGNLEIISPISDSSPIAEFIKSRGTALHHIGLKVKNINESLLTLKNAGYRLIDEAPRVGARGKLIAFIHPKSTGGILFELCADPK